MISPSDRPRLAGKDRDIDLELKIGQLGEVFVLYPTEMQAGRLRSDVRILSF